MMPDFFPATVQDKANMWFLDCASQYSGAPAITISGLGYLEAQTVDIVADGSYVAGLTVTGGSITLPKAASLVTIGLGYSSIMEVMPIDMSTQGGTAQGKVKRPDRTAIRLFASLGVQYGSDLTKMDELSFTDSTSIMDQSPDFYTGDKIVSMPISYGLTGQFFLQQTKPYPLTILAIMPDVSITA